MATVAVGDKLQPPMSSSDQLQWKECHECNLPLSVYQLYSIATIKAAFAEGQEE